MRTELTTLLGRAGPMTLAVAATQATTAAAGAWTLSGTLARVVPDDGVALTPARLGTALEALLHGTDSAVASALAFGAYALLAPLLLLGWMHAIGHPGSMRTHLRAAVRRYPAALSLTLATLVGWIALGTGALATVRGLDLLTPYLPTPALWAVAIAALLGLLAAALVLATTADLCRGALVVRDERLLAALRRGLGAWRTRLASHRLASALASLGCFTLGDLLARSEALPLAPLSAPVVVQLAAFSAVLARGHFLCATTRALTHHDRDSAQVINPR